MHSSFINSASLLCRSPKLQIPVWMWHLGTRFCDGLGSPEGMVGLDLKGLSKPKQFSDSETSAELGMRDGKVCNCLFS